MKGKVRLATGALLVGAALAAYFAFVRPGGRRWDATLEEGTRTMPGDDFVRDANYETTKAITIRAPIASVWPWLARIGYERTGVYSYRLLSRFFGILERPNAMPVPPRDREIKVGDKVPLFGREWPVILAEPERSLVLGEHVDRHGSGWTWAFRLYEDESGGTRLVVRARARTPRNPLWRVGIFAFDIIALNMTRQMLLTLKERAESLPPTSSPT